MERIKFLIKVVKRVTDMQKKNELQIYELVLLLKPTINEQNIVEKIEYYKALLTKKGSQLMVKNFGKKSLSYLIKGFDTGISLQLVYLGNGDLVKQINTEIQRDESVLRSITTKLNGKNLAKEYNPLFN